MTTAAQISTGTSISLIRRALSRTLRDNNVETAELDARLLLQIALGFDHTELVRHETRMLDANEIGNIESLAARRIAGEPVARIAGFKEFWGLRLQLGPATLSPRPETETVVEAALAWIAKRSNQQAGSLRIADLGTGSGALLLALLCELPDAWGVGTDLCEDAVAIAAINATRLGLAPRATFVACDFGCALDGGFDLIVSNPPYIASGEIASLAREVRDHDPLLALDGGEDGLIAYRAIARDVARLLRPGGAVVVELGAGQGEAVADIFRTQDLIMAGPAALDLGGIPRALIVCKP